MEFIQFTSKQVDLMIKSFDSKFDRNSDFNSSRNEKARLRKFVNVQSEFGYWSATATIAGNNSLRRASTIKCLLLLDASWRLLMVERHSQNAEQHSVDTCATLPARNCFLERLPGSSSVLIESLLLKSLYRAIESLLLINFWRTLKSFFFSLEFHRKSVISN